ncbi:MAG: hypothetical protein WBP81_06480 [Solirubrobacteraceae bacterium]
MYDPSRSWGRSRATSRNQVAVTGDKTILAWWILAGFFLLVEAVFGWTEQAGEIREDGDGQGRTALSPPSGPAGETDRSRWEWRENERSMCAAFQGHRGASGWAGTTHHPPPHARELKSTFARLICALEHRMHAQPRRSAARNPV